MWARLKELNHNLEKMKEQKTLDNKKKKLNVFACKLILITNIFACK